MDQKSIDGVARYLARHIHPFRSGILRTGKLIGKWVAFGAVVSASVSLILDGTQFFTRQLPAAAAFVSKEIFLRNTFRPVLARRIIKTDPAYTNFCLETSQVLDLDNDGDATDLLLTLFPRGGEPTCPDLHNGPDSVYVVLKTVAWRGFWPSFSVVRTISQSDIGNFALGSAYPMTFEQLGPFLFGSIYGTDFPGYAVYGYANGELQSLGSYRPVGSLVENPQAEPKAQIGNRLILFAEEGMKSFELLPEGRFKTRSLSAYDIVDLNNEALVIEDSVQMPDLVEKIKTEKSTGQDATDTLAKRYQFLDPHNNGCNSTVFMNGSQIELKPIEDQKPLCGADVLVSPGTVIISNVACSYQGLLASTHFPWGRVYDLSQSEHSISCPEDGENDGGFQYILTIKLQ